MSAQPKMPLDFSKIRNGKFNQIHKPEGEYLGVITSFEDTKSKAGTAMWVFGVTLRRDPSAVYPVYCSLSVDQIWKLRNLMLAAGFQVPKARVEIKGGDLLGKDIAVCLEDDEYEGKPKSVIGSFFPASEYEGDADEVEEPTTPSDHQSALLDLLRRIAGGGPHGPEGIEAVAVALAGSDLHDGAIGPAINNLASSVYETGDKIRGGLDNIAQAIRGAVRCTGCHEWFIPADLVQVDEIGYRPNKPTCKPCAAKVIEPTGAAQEWARRTRIERQASRTHKPEELADSERLRAEAEGQ